MVSISRLCGQLDKWIWDDEYSVTLESDTSVNSHQIDPDMQIDEFLKNSIQAFAARWLPLTVDTSSSALSIADSVRACWRRAHRDMLKTINRPSYRSMLALLLFAMTPIPIGIPEDEELDGVSGQVCIHAALQHIQTLRARQRSLLFNGTRINFAKPTNASSSSPASIATAKFINAEGTAYWAALTFDTSASLTLSCKPLLSSGLFGSEYEPAWRMVRSSMEVFQSISKEWKDAEFEMDDERANQIIAAGSSWKLLVWKVTANLKESLRDGHDETEVSRAFNSVLDAIDRFNATYRALLSACQNRIQFFSQETRLRWCKHLNRPTDEH